MANGSNALPVPMQADDAEHEHTDPAPRFANVASGGIHFNTTTSPAAESEAVGSAADPALPSVTRRLIILVAAATAPLLVLVGALLMHYAQQQRFTNQQQIRSTAVAMSAAIDAEILRAKAILMTMRNDRSLIGRRNWAAVYTFAEAAVQDEPGARITLYDPSGQLVLTTFLPYGTALPRTAAPEPIRQVIQTKKPYISNLLVGNLSHQYVVAIYVPIIEDGAAPYVLSIAFSPDTFSSILQREVIPNGGFGQVIDRTGTIIARTLGDGALVGKPAMADLVRPALQAEEGTYKGHTIEGVAIEAVFIRSRLTGWTVSLGMEEGTLDVPLWRALWSFGGGGGAICAAALLLAWYQGRRFVQMVGLLCTMARALGRGERLPPARLGIHEMQLIADGMVAASTSLRRHQDDREALLARFHTTNDVLSVANVDLQSFSYTVSHDLRTPLRAIEGFSRILADEYGQHLDVEGLRLLGIVCDNTQKMSHLIDDLLAFSYAGRRETVSVVVDMTALVHAVADELRTSESGSTLEFRIGTLPPVRADPVMMKQALLHLIDNAIKYSARNPSPLIEVEGHVSGAETVYVVRDNGVGFDPKYVGKLFNVFQRLHGPDQFTGTGIGLAIVKRIITRHGGRVWAEGELGVGASFYFAMPSVAETRANSQSERESEASAKTSHQGS